MLEAVGLRGKIRQSMTGRAAGGGGERERRRDGTRTGRTTQTDGTHDRKQIQTNPGHGRDIGRGTNPTRGCSGGKGRYSLSVLSRYRRNHKIQR